MTRVGRAYTYFRKLGPRCYKQIYGDEAGKILNEECPKCPCNNVHICWYIRDGSKKFRRCFKRSKRHVFVYVYVRSLRKTFEHHECFGRLMVIGRAESRNGKARVRCICTNCMTEGVYYLQNLKAGRFGNHCRNKKCRDMYKFEQMKWQIPKISKEGIEIHECVA